MLLPQTYTATLILMILGMLCLGSWANTLKLGGKWRFELYYFDFALGVLAAGVLLAYTAGSIGYDGFQFTDDLVHAGKRQWFYAFVAGIIFNFANMLLTGAVSVAGMAVAFPIGIGSAVVVGSLLSLLLGHGGNAALLLGGCLVIIAAIVVDGFAFSWLNVRRHETQARAGKAKSTRRPSSAKGIIIAAVSGLLMGSFAPLIRDAMEGDLGLGPYSVNAIFAVGVFFSTLLFNMFFMNLPMEGDPADIGDFFKAKFQTHLLGIAGGAIWMAGATAVLVASVAPGAPLAANLGPQLNFQLSQGFVIVAALWGLLAWKEFSGSDAKIKLMAVLVLVLYLAGLLLVSLAPLYVRAA